MKIAVPTSNGTLCAHFGHCQQFAVLDVDPASKAIMTTEYYTPPAHEPGVLPQWLSQMGCKVIIAGGMGGRAVSLFNQNGVSVITGAVGGTPNEIVHAYLNNELVIGDNACDH